MPSEVLIESKRFASLGGLEDSDVRRILENFVFSLPGHLFSLEMIRDRGNEKELTTALHKLKGSANTCGFVAIAKVAAAWDDAPDLFVGDFHADLKEAIHASIHEWNSITAGVGSR
ncbi:MAG: Hpt domain-containing protein [Luteolibacter sp.]